MDAVKSLDLRIDLIADLCNQLAELILALPFRDCNVLIACRLAVPVSEDDFPIVSYRAGEGNPFGLWGRGRSKDALGAGCWR
jgi:hypothetical protein